MKEARCLQIDPAYERESEDLTALIEAKPAYQ
jgi:hypothetical protein